jgi:sialate O-acetylesterase
MKTYTLKWSFLLFLCLSSFLPSPDAFAEVKLPEIFGDNMVLQRNKQVIIWGRATTAAEKIVIRIAGKTYRTRAANDSTWSVVLAPTQEGGPYSLEVSGDNKIVFRNVMFGDIWLCVGQNNMDMPLNKSAEGQKELLRAEYPMIRLFSVKKRYSTRPLADLATEEGWQACDIETASRFSATAYYFGKELFNHNRIAVGLIQATYNGSKIESWLSPDVLKTFPDLKEKVEQIESHPDYLAEKKKEYEEVNLKKWYANLEKLDEGFKDSIGGGWESPTLNTRDWSEMYQPRVWASKGHELADYSGSVWFRKKFTLPNFLKGKDISLHLGALHDYDFTYVNGKKIGETYTAETNRIYKIPKELLKDTDNEIVVFSIHFAKHRKRRPFAFFFGRKLEV